MPVNRLLIEFEEVPNTTFSMRNGTVDMCYEPMLKSRFLVTFPEEFGDLEAFCVCAVSKIRWSSENGWDEIEISLYELVQKSSSENLMRFLRWRERPGNGETALAFRFDLLDPTGCTISRWEVYGLVSRVEFDAMEYGSDELRKNKIVISPIDISLVSDIYPNN